MAVKIRMQRHGSKKRPFYFIVAASTTSPRDGKFIEKLGTYNPLTVPATVNLDRDRALDWLQKGAQPTNTVRKILSFKGVLYMKHLQRGVGLGLFDDNAAKEKFDQWLVDHEKSVIDRDVANRKSRKEKSDLATQESVRKVEERLAAKKAIEDEKAAEEAKAQKEAKAAEEAQQAEEAAKVAEEAPKAEETEKAEETPKAEEAKAPEAKAPEAEKAAEEEKATEENKDAKPSDSSEAAPEA